MRGLFFVVALLLLLLLVEAKPTELKMLRKAKKIVRDADGVALNVRDPRRIFNKVRGEATA